MEAFLLPILSATIVFISFMLIASSMRTSRGHVQDRVRRMAEENALAVGTGGGSESLSLDEDITPTAAFMAGLLRLIGTDIEKFRKNSQMRFYRAGIQSASAPIYYLFYKRIGFLFVLLLAFMVFMSPAEGTMKLANYVGVTLLVILAFGGADLFLSNEETKRKKMLQRSFPDALDLMLVCVESGLALDGALARVCRELGRAYPEITQELNRTRLELTLLNDRSQALANLADRTDLLSFRALTTTLLQSEKFGTSLTDTLRVLSEDYRNNRLMIAEEKAGRLPVLMTVPLILLMMPALFLIILGPVIIQAMKVSASQQ